MRQGGREPVFSEDARQMQQFQAETVQMSARDLPIFKVLAVIPRGAVLSNAGSDWTFREREFHEIPDLSGCSDFSLRCRPGNGMCDDKLAE